VITRRSLGCRACGSDRVVVGPRRPTGIVSPAPPDVVIPPHEASHASRQGSVARRADRDAVGVVLWRFITAW
jgi:hypothetical protein